MSIARLRHGLPSGSGRHHFLRRCPSASPRPASSPPAGSSADGSRPPVTEAAWLPTRRDRRTSPSTCRTSRCWSHTCDTHRTSLHLPHTRPAPDELFFREPCLLYLPSPLEYGLYPFLEVIQGLRSISAGAPSLDQLRIEPQLVSTTTRTCPPTLQAQSLGQRHLHQLPAAHVHPLHHRAALGRPPGPSHFTAVVTYQTPSGTRGKEKLPEASQVVRRRVET